MTKDQVLIGLTGSIGMGKSTTAELFAAEGVPVWDADRAVARLYARGGAAVGPLGKIAPEAICDGAVDKNQLRGAIAKDPDLLKRIEPIVHPLVREDRERFKAEHADAPVLLFDIPLLFETGSEGSFDKVVVVSVSEDAQRQRVLERGTMDEAEFELIKSKQMPDAEKRQKADVVIETYTLDGARSAVQNLLEQLRG